MKFNLEVELTDSQIAALHKIREALIENSARKVGVLVEEAKEKLLLALGNIFTDEGMLYFTVGNMLEALNHIGNLPAEAMVAVFGNAHGLLVQGVADSKNMN